MPYVNKITLTNLLIDYEIVGLYFIYVAHYILFYINSSFYNLFLIKI